MAEVLSSNCFETSANVAVACEVERQACGECVGILVPFSQMVSVIRWDEKAGLRRDAIRSQVIDALEAQEIKETGNEED